MSTRNSKRIANNPKPAKPAKRGHKKQNALSINVNNLQDKTKVSTASKRSCKKNQEVVASSSSQVVDELLSNNDKAASTSRLSQSPDIIPSQKYSPALGLGIGLPILKLENISPTLEQLSPTLKSRTVPPQRALGSRTNILNNSTSFYQLPTNPVFAPLRTSSILESNFSNSALSHANSNSVTIPSIFNEITIYQICLWLYANPNILQLANYMNLSMQTSAADGSQFMPSISLALSNTMQNQNDKCFFLRTRNPPKKALEDLVRQIIKYDLNSTEGIKWLQIAKRHFGDFRNKLINGVEVSRDIEGTRALDRLTKNIAIPSRNGKNFASNIKL
ncbi:707_t:CDS:2 [Dentiscutata erythropus]|uniref:707_t:CDS:1 n=1 Tax=Dentiscutata erythropus TaxID=1348616 RepID=A0A9N9HE95_9GLOM|nr:707_t:CDS:2 [Dentiscutata erythropus]